MHRQICLPSEGLKEIVKEIKSMNPKKTLTDSYDYMIKVIIVGDSGVGKTNIISRFCAKEKENDGNFKENHVATIGVDFSVKMIQIDEKRIKLQIWDTAGQQRFKTITQTYYRGAAGIILTYSVDSIESFNSIEKWMSQVSSKTDDRVKKILIANKIDLEYEHQFTSEAESCRKVSKLAGLAMSQKYGMDYMEVSAKTNEGISQVFYSIAEEIKNKIEQDHVVDVDDAADISKTISIDLKRNRNYIRTKKCGIQYTCKDKETNEEQQRKRCFC